MKKTKLTTTFALCLKHDACEGGYKKLSEFLGGDEIYGKDKPINLLTILESNGIEDCIWALRATAENSDKIAQLFAADCAESVLYLFEDQYPDDKRPRQAIQAARDYAGGRIYEGAWAAAWAATGDAVWDARAAARAAAWAAAGTAAGTAARAAARAAAWAAAGTAARAAARAAAWAAAGAAARAAAWDAAWAAAGDAAWDAEKAKQGKILSKYLIVDHVKKPVAATADA